MIDDIRALVKAAQASTGARPNTIIMGPRVYLRLARGFMRKRAWRRLRGRMKGERRAFRRSLLSLPESMLSANDQGATPEGGSL